MADDRSKLNELLVQRQQQQSQNQGLLEKLQGRGSQEEGSATEELLQRLRQPESDREGWGRVARAASDLWGSGGGRMSKLKGPEERELDRLSEASKIELAQEAVDFKREKELNKNAGGEIRNKRYDKDLSALESYGLVARGAKRGATRIGKQFDALGTVQKLQNYIDDIESGKITFDDVSNLDFSAAFSGLVTGRAPGIELIRETKYGYLLGDLKHMYQYATGRPQENISPEQFTELKNMIQLLGDSTKHEMSKTQAHLFNTYKARLERNPRIYDRYKKKIFDKWIDFDAQGDAIERKFEDPFLTKDPSYAKQGSSQEDVRMRQALKDNPGYTEKEIRAALKGVK